MTEEEATKKRGFFGRLFRKEVPATEEEPAGVHGRTPPETVPEPSQVERHVA